jgi:hypothetical protein
MCIFITLIAKASDKEIVSEILVNAGRRAELIDNPYLRAATAPDEIQLLTTNGHCDCETVLGCGSMDTSAKNYEDEARKLRRKKWSQGKIERYIEDRRKAEEKKASSRATDSLDLWEGVIREAYKRNVSRIGLFYTMYSGTIATENFEPIVTEAKLSQDALRSMVEGNILYFVGF